MDFIPGIDGPSEGVPRVLACFSNNLLRREPLKLVDGGESQRTFIYIKDAIEAVLLMIENPARANGHIFNVGNPYSEVTVRQLAEMMTQVKRSFNLSFSFASCGVNSFVLNLMQHVVDTMFDRSTQR
ncbi:UDP-D-apiose/UDP-D-xylose synthase 2 [Capsicum chinense]|nr:UDP-D-apiose/UDP-D-xylose synthase 2 [Capsicum chinense]